MAEQAPQKSSILGKREARSDSDDDAKGDAATPAKHQKQKSDDSKCPGDKTCAIMKRMLAGDLSEFGMVPMCLVWFSHVIPS